MRCRMPGAFAIAMFFALVACGCRGGRRPDLVLITVDTLRPDFLSCYGGEPDVGRGLCRLADEGVRFTWAFSAAPTTAPSIASLLTSRYPSFHGVNQLASTALPDEIPILTQVLSDAGYHTAAFIGSPVLDRHKKLDRGFDVWDAHMDSRERNRPGHVERTAEDATDAALAWARSAPRPWFLWIHYQDPHGPYDPPDTPHSRVSEPGKALPVLDDHSGYGGIPRYQRLPGLRNVNDYVGRYTDEIRYLDRHVTRLLDGLDGLGTVDMRPAVLLTADHGEAFGEDGYYFAHGHSLGIDQIRVPLLWRPAGPVRVHSSDQPVSLLAVAPTLLAAAGLAPPESFQGRALPDPGSGPTAERPAFFAEQERRVAVIDGHRYYARDRAPMSHRTFDRISGGSVFPLPTRVAELATDGHFPSYGAVSETDPPDPLEHSVTEFLRSARHGIRPDVADVPAEARARLRALGYLDPAATSPSP